MIIIPTPAASYASHKISLAGKTYNFVFRFNSLMQRWMLDIYLNEVEVILGQGIIEGSPLFYAEPIVNFEHGILIPVRNVNTTNPVGRDNLGIGKEYSLIYLTMEEWENV